MNLDALRFLTSTLALTLWLGLGSPTKILMPPAEVAIVSLQNEIAAETDTTEGDEGDSGDTGSDDSGSEDDGGGSSDEDSD